MVQLCIILLVLGIIALLVEVYLPGTEVFGIVGVISLVASAVLAVMFVTFGWFIVAGQALIVAGFIYYLFQLSRKKQLEGKFILNENLVAPEFDDLRDYVGKEGRTVTLLGPHGEVDFNGVRVQATSNGNIIELGTKVRVTETMSDKVIVRALEGN